ncbi:unnamed protein product [Urochloa decumbens]|uniref:Uncharacterized protein n=1 Tax=Urochloa decumbens TaxID=240449 RepID=A0ABC9D7V7_9POAL
MYKRLAVLFLACAVISNHKVNGDTDGLLILGRKVAIFRACMAYLVAEHPSVPPAYMKKCCEVVTMKPKIDMQTILNYCNKNERENLRMQNLLRLQPFCEMHHYPPPAARRPHPPPSHQAEARELEAVV